MSDDTVNRIEPVRQVSGRGVFVPGDDIDTDRIIPARFLKCVTFDGLGEHAFHDERYDEDGTPRPHPFNDPRFEGAKVLLTGRNFGCGSSREHAPQSLHKAGIDAIVAVSFAEIFFGNCTALGVPCVTLPADAIGDLAARIDANPSIEITVDLTARELRAGDYRADCGIPESAREALLAGRWDPLAELLEGAEAAREVWRRLPYAAW